MPKLGESGRIAVSESRSRREFVPPTTLLQYVAVRLMGDPVFRGQYGEFYWHCPMCQGQGSRPSLHTMPSKPAHKDRYYCFKCPFRGDIDDLIFTYFAHDSYARRCSRLEQYRREYETEMMEAASRVAAGDAIVLRASFLSPGSAGSDDPDTDSVNPRLRAAYDGLSSDEVETLIRARYIMEGKVKAKGGGAGGVRFEDVTDYCLRMQQWDLIHTMLCDDPSCNKPMCQEARFLRQPSRFPESLTWVG